MNKKPVIWDRFPLYDKLHTKRVTYYSGKNITILYPMKETKCFFMSIPTWSYYCSDITIKKPNTLQFEIPILEDIKSIEILEELSWKGYLREEINKGNNDIFEAVNLLRKLFTNKKLCYIFDLNTIIINYINDIDTNNYKNLINTFNYDDLELIAKNSVCYNVAFSRGTANWYLKDRNKICPYAHAGEILFIVTNDIVYFEIKRNF